jgi:hypothetical protein
MVVIRQTAVSGKFSSTKTTNNDRETTKTTDNDNSFNHFDNHLASCSLQYVGSFKATTT